MCIRDSRPVAFRQTIVDDGNLNLLVRVSRIERDGGVGRIEIHTRHRRTIGGGDEVHRAGDVYKRQAWISYSANHFRWQTCAKPLPGYYREAEGWSPGIQLVPECSPALRG